MRLILTVTLCIGLLLPVCWAGEPPQLKDEKAKDSYSLGYEFGQSVRKQGVDVDVDVLVAAFRESLEGKQPAISPEEIRRTLENLRIKAVVIQDRRAREFAANNRKEGKEFLEANKKEKGVKVLASGLQYKILSEGKGPSPKVLDLVTLNYSESLIDGTEIENTFSSGKPVTMRTNSIVRGLTEALQLMKVGSKWQVFVPENLAYGERPYNRIPPYSTLIFEIQLLSIDKSANAAEEESAPATGHPPGKLPPNKGGRNSAKGFGG